MKTKKTKIVFFTGSGISEESGLHTFRGHNGLWHEYRVEEVASIEGWMDNPQRVLEFYNKRRREMMNALPNKAHRSIGLLQEDKHTEVSVITQNIDTLHEQGSAHNVIHLHGRIDQLKCFDHSTLYPYDKDVEIGDTCEKGSQLRPNVVWFGEALDHSLINKATELISHADYLVIVGTSLLVQPAAGLIHNVNKNCTVYYVAPDEEKNMDVFMNRKNPFRFIKEKATVGVDMVISDIMGSPLSARHRGHSH